MVRPLLKCFGVPGRGATSPPQLPRALSAPGPRVPHLGQQVSELQCTTHLPRLSLHMLESSATVLGVVGRLLRGNPPAFWACENVYDRQNYTKRTTRNVLYPAAKQTRTVAPTGGEGCVHKIVSWGTMEVRGAPFDSSTLEIYVLDYNESGFRDRSIRSLALTHAITQLSWVTAPCAAPPTLAKARVDSPLPQLVAWQTSAIPVCVCLLHVALVEG
jgi:hypothetical protein